MPLALVHSRANVGVQSPPVSVEVHLAGGLPGLTIVGLPETAVKESKDRVRAALANSRFQFPTRRITVNLAPADLPKEGGRFDLPIAVGILLASGQLRGAADGYELLGELALSGALRPVRGVLPAALAAQAAGRSCLLPADNAREAALVRGLAVHGAADLLGVCAHLEGTAPLARATPPDWADGAGSYADLGEVRGQTQAKRALEIAAAGGHSLLMLGPPGTGKTMLASRLPGLLPPLDETEALEVAAVWSVSEQGFAPECWRKRPFRAPHHTASAVALVGGGSQPKPGEVSLAHRGVLFLDELPEFERRVLEVLREPLEAGRITISRAARQADFPAAIQLVAAMNPCPCGYLGDPAGRCRCTPDQVQRYRGRISGPLLDRLDLRVEVGRVPRDALLDPAPPAPETPAVRERVSAARERQRTRAGRLNAALTPTGIGRWCALTAADRALLERALIRLNLSARATHRVLRVARTIADLASAENIATAHLTEALSYRAVQESPIG